MKYDTKMENFWKDLAVSIQQNRRISSKALNRKAALVWQDSLLERYGFLKNWCFLW